MTMEERTDRLEGVVDRVATEMANFIRGQTEMNATVTRALTTLTQPLAAIVDDVRLHSSGIRRHDEALAAIAEDVRLQSTRIQRLDDMIARFDAWLRGQGPKNGHEK
jgi:hypothetical protein